MNRYVVLLRGIGPATHAAMPLGELAQRCRNAGFGEVTNIGNTGNLVLQSDKPQAAVEAAIGSEIKRFGLATEVFTRTARQFAKLIALAPFAEAAKDHPQRVGVCFFHKDPHWPEAYRNYAGPERLAMVSNHLIVDYGAQLLVSRLTIERTVGAHMTQRNWSSILRIASALDLEQGDGPD
ncbi:MAG TPA: DUF1697 domain-containing protein [Devosiaceae bacterium]|nr:DUF1697 domain-containing protein [Devosiaceae bacterium]